MKRKPNVNRKKNDAEFQIWGSAVLLRQIALKFGPAEDAVHRQICDADPNTLLRWSERILTAESLDELLR